MGLLDIDLPRSPSPDYFNQMMKKTRDAIKGKTPREICDSLPECTKTQIEEALILGREVAWSSYFRSEDMLLCCLLNLVFDIALEHGRNDMSPFAISSYGALLTVTGPYDEAYEYMEIALEMAEARKTIVPRTMNVVYLLTWFFTRPLKDLASRWKETITISMQEGDSMSLGTACQYAGNVSVFAGQSLWSLEK